MSAHSNRARLAALAAGLVAVVVAASVSATAFGASGRPDLSKVTLNEATYPSPNGDDILLKAAGLDKTPYTVKYQSYPSSALQTAAVNTHTADLARGSGVANVLIAATGTVNFLSVATLKISTNQQDTIVLKSSGITSVAQLKGQKVAYVPNTTSQYFLLRQLQAAGLAWTDIKPVPLDPTTGLAALLSNSVVAFATFGNIVQAEQQGATVLADGGPYLKGRLGALVGTYNAYSADLKDQGKIDAIADFIARVDTAQAWTRSHATQWAQLLAKATNLPYATELDTFQSSEKLVNSSVGPNQPEGISNEQDYANTFLKAGVISSPVNVAATYSTKLNALIAKDEAAYRKQYPSYFVTPAWLVKP
jgi:sulfonate transport system substrate-binding protein